MNIIFDTHLIISSVLGITVITLAWMVYSLNHKLSKFLIGQNSENLSESFTHIHKTMMELDTYKKDLETYLTTMEKRLKKSVQGVHTVRFNPFAGSTGSGGNQSFATAFINEQKNGVVISSLYARERVSIFAKPIISGTSDYELSDEENQAIQEALKSLSS